MRITIGSGFITNSSSVVHYFDKSLLEDPEVAAFIKAYDLQDGIIGKEMYSRSGCSSFLPTRELKEEARRRFNAAMDDYGVESHIDFGANEDNVVTLVYGDEYYSFASILCKLLSEAADRKGSGDLGSNEFH